MLGPFPASSVQARLAEIADLKLVGSASDLQNALENAPSATPAVYVIVQEQGEQPKGFSGNVLVQNVVVAVQLVVFVSSYADKGRDALKTLDEVIRPAIREALVGWAPSPGFTTLSLQASRQERYRAPQLVAQEVYRSGYRIQK